MNRHELLCAALLPAIVGVGCGKSQPQFGDGPPSSLTLVEVERVGEESIQKKWSFFGEVRAQSRAEVAAGASGEVTRVTVHTGDTIRQGQLLVEVDSALAAARHEVTRAEVERSQELLAQAERDLKRLQRLEEGVVSDADLEQKASTANALKTELRARRAAAREAEAQLQRHFVRAPFDGVVALRIVNLGDWVDPGEPVLELISSGEIDVMVSVGAGLLSGIRIDDGVELRGQGEITARVVSIVPALDPVARTARIRLLPEQTAPWLLPGSTVDAVFTLPVGSDGVVVSRDAVLEGPTGARLVEVVDDKARSVPIEILARANDRFLVRGEGLEINDNVVIRGNERLRPGEEVRTVSDIDQDQNSEPGTGIQEENPIKHEAIPEKAGLLLPGVDTQQRGAADTNDGAKGRDAQLNAQGDSTTLVPTKKRSSTDRKSPDHDS